MEGDSVMFVLKLEAGRTMRFCTLRIHAYTVTWGWGGVGGSGSLNARVFGLNMQKRWSHRPWTLNGVCCEFSGGEF